MLALAYLRDHPEEVRRRLATRHDDLPLDEVLRLDERRRALLSEGQALRERRNAANETIKRSGRPSEAQRSELRSIAERVKELDGEEAEVGRRLDDLLLRLPNLPHASVPEGADERDNVEVKRWGELPSFDFAPRPHWEIGERLGILDLEAGVKLAGARFYVTRGLGARLQRALISFFLDVHVARQGYTEVSTPYLIKSVGMTEAGKLPKFADDAYYLEADDLWLNPTAEVPLTNLHRDEILDVARLPLNYTAYCPSWRREAGSAGRDTRGTIRLHQFHKVEMYKLCRPDDSYPQMAKMVEDAEALLQALDLPYRAVELCSGDLGFTATKTIDLEAWLPGLGEFKEISSVSNCETFQSRRANTRFRPAPGERPEFVHTLNGSGLPIDRTFAAVLERHQQADGSVLVPEPLQPYMGVAVLR